VAGLLEAEVVDLQLGGFAILPAADDRLGDLVGVNADLRSGVLGPQAQLIGEIGDKHQLTALSFGVAGEQFVDQAAGRPGNSGVQQGAGANSQDGAGLVMDAAGPGYPAPRGR